ncbi:hypothetical protein DXA87_06635 [Desulfotomaculum sp. OF05-3]|nr:hypothetical protein DXC33_05080 [Clostridiaceae bacterium TF01-6]RGE15977.1 hypothetical protein DXA87_06635 [Desulfotomaculum sp. OF05-3]
MDFFFDYDRCRCVSQ